MTNTEQRIQELEKRIEVLEAQKQPETVDNVGNDLAPWQEYFADLENWPDWANYAACEGDGLWMFFEGKPCLKISSDVFVEWWQDAECDGSVVYIHLSKPSLRPTKHPYPANSLVKRPQAAQVPEKHDPSWIPQEGENYWFVTYRGGINAYAWENSTLDQQHLARGNVFKEPEHARASKRKCKAIVAAERHAARCDWSTPMDFKWVIELFEDDLRWGPICLQRVSRGIRIQAVFWPTEEDARDFIENDPHGPDYLAMLKGDL